MNEHETIHYLGEEVDYQNWLKNPALRGSWWSPAGVHIEALVQIDQSKDVSQEVIDTLLRVDPDMVVLSTISAWNGLRQRGKDENKAAAIGTIMTRVIDKYQDNQEINTAFVRCNPEGVSVFVGKEAIVNMAVYLRREALKG